MIRRLGPSLCLLAWGLAGLTSCVMPVGPPPRIQHRPAVSMDTYMTRGLRCELDEPGCVVSPYTRRHLRCEHVPYGHVALDPSSGREFIRPYSGSSSVSDLMAKLAQHEDSSPGAAGTATGSTPAPATGSSGSPASTNFAPSKPQAPPPRSSSASAPVTDSAPGKSAPPSTSSSSTTTAASKPKPASTTTATSPAAPAPPPPQADDSTPAVSRGTISRPASTKKGG